MKYHSSKNLQSFKKDKKGLAKHKKNSKRFFFLIDFQALYGKVGVEHSEK